jgi:hypothetical protein
MDKPPEPSDWPAPEARAWLDAVPAPVLAIDAPGTAVWANAAAQALAPTLGPTQWLTWLDAARPLLQGRVSSLELALPDPEAGTAWVRLQTRDLPGGGRAIGLQPIDALRAARAEVDQLQEMLDLARDFGRLGFWERDARTLEGRWDRQVQALRGLHDLGAAPSFEASMAQVALADRESLNRVFIESLHQPGSYSHRFSLRTADGTLRRVHSQWHVLAGPDGLPARAVGLLVDDTETLALAGVSGELESQLALAVDLGRIAIWRHDLLTQRMQYNSQAWAVLDLPARSEGLAIEEVRALIHPDDLPAVLTSARLAMETDKPVDVEARYRRADGSWRQVLTRRVLQRNASGEPIAFVGVAMDVTERRNAELALRNAAERVALVTRSAGLGTWEVDLRDETAFWDEQMWLLRGLPPQTRAMTPTERMDRVHPEDRERVMALHRQAMDKQQPAEYEFRVVWPDGQVHWIATRSQTLFDERGQPTRRIGVNWDITAARTAAAMRQEREIAQRESAAKSQFMARISHELRTPLNAVLGFTELLLADEGDDSPAGLVRRRRLQHVKTAGQHLLTLINDVLDLAGLESGELRVDLAPVALARVLGATLPMLDPLLQARQVQMHQQIDAQEELVVLADATRLRQVLLNLLSNAVKYNQAGGQVEIRAWQDGATVHVRVSDTGRGMSDEQLRHLFEPFNRLGTEGSGIEGSGIGLTIAKTLAERMGGQLEAHSRIGQGSSFELRLPASTPAALATSPEASPTRGHTPARVHASSRHVVLYIEDNPVNALIISELLARRSDIELKLAETGAQGLAQARLLLPDLLLLDMQLPDMNGLEVLARLRDDPALSRMRCMALSANAMPEDIERALQAGADGYWTKPLDFRAFMAALDALFGPSPA